MPATFPKSSSDEYAKILVFIHFSPSDIFCELPSPSAKIRYRPIVIIILKTVCRQVTWVRIPHPAGNKERHLGFEVPFLKSNGRVPMDLVSKYFADLTIRELYEILKARSEVFVVEQNCVYPENRYVVLGAVSDTGSIRGWEILVDSL